MRKVHSGALIIGYLILYIALVLLLISYLSSREAQGGRIGAICRDGWISSATDSGTCSQHGGVSRWRYSQTPGSDPSDGYNAALVMAAIGGALILYSKSVGERLKTPQGLAPVAQLNSKPAATPQSARRHTTSGDVSIQRPATPLDSSKPQKCTCGAWMFKTKDSSVYEIFRCSRTTECGKTRPVSHPEI